MIISKTGYFEVFNGCAGDMIVGCLIDAGVNPSILKNELQKIPISNYTIKIKKVKRKTNSSHFISATQFIVILKEKENQRKYTEIVNLIEKSSLSDDIKRKTLKIFNILAISESKVHKEKIDNVHFHQIGQTDAIIEIASAVIGLKLLNIESVYSSSIGISMPSPATLEILKGLPVLIKHIPYEISTPTGVSILKGLCKFHEIDEKISIEGYGYGTGTSETLPSDIMKFIYGKEIDKKKEEIYIIETNIDDMNPVIFEYLYEKLFQAGATDVSVFTGIGKKNRPVFNLQIMVNEENFEKVKEIIFSETTTIGFRYQKEDRIILQRKIKEIKTKWGSVKIKISFYGGKIYNISPEYDDCKKISKKFKIPLKNVITEVNNLSKNISM
ncbi:MAG TPA: nickel pincer cofactor biosynthesis protein LarC [bacterium]|nr:nickel pincer cofactor biosynthesis protein LarC [bacterium]